LVLFVLLSKVRLCSLYCQCCDLNLDYLGLKLFFVDFIYFLYEIYKSFTKQQNDIGPNETTVTITNRRKKTTKELSLKLNLSVTRCL
jgi:hypothetical protein